MSTTKSKKSAQIRALVDTAARTIPPMWPLEATVAVNPFLGANTKSLDATASVFAPITGQALTMQPSWFQEKLEAGEVKDEDLSAALEACGAPSDISPADIRNRLSKLENRAPARIPTVKDLAALPLNIDLRGVMTDRVTAWAANFFDQGQALWQITDKGAAWASWRDYATNDLTPEILGLEGFCAFASRLTDDVETFIDEALDELGVSGNAAEIYLTQILFDLGGWAQLGRYRLWQAELAGSSDPIMGDLLAIGLAWEVFAYRAASSEIMLDWKRANKARERAGEAGEDFWVLGCLQFALDHAEQRRIAGLLSAPSVAQNVEARPPLQAAFCIDVRSEVFRRALESVSETTETLGFAGFFGLGIDHKSFASDVHERRLPVLLNPGLETFETGEDEISEDRAKRFRLRAVRAWGRFKLAAVSSFAFVESAGPIYVPKLLQGALGLKSGKSKNGPAPKLHPSVTLEARVDAAHSILKAMSLTQNFARLVLLCGHGASVVNNPHASALQCGACGGYSGEVNARLLAGLLNEEAVRQELSTRGIDIPADTYFVGGLHDTTSDTVTIYDDGKASSHSKDIEAAELLLTQAGKLARAERAATLPSASRSSSLLKRGRSWSQTRPEWGLAGCSAFIAAPRERTLAKDLSGRSFLHSYDWREDKDFSVLELILTAPVVVASWISLQYYGSSVAPDMFGAGNKLLHNVVGGVGVLEGNGGTLRAGLPIQSVSDGLKLRHTPVRLSVCVEAPREAISAILAKHDDVRALFDNHWLHLFAMDDNGALAHRYDGKGGWQPAFSARQAAAPEGAAA